MNRSCRVGHEPSSELGMGPRGNRTGSRSTEAADAPASSGLPRLAPPDCRCRHCETRRAAVLLAVEATVLDAERRRALELRDEVLAEWLRPTAVAP